MFSSTLGFSRSADRMALIPVWPNLIGMWEKAMREETGHNLKYFLFIYVFSVKNGFPQSWLSSYAYASVGTCPLPESWDLQKFKEFGGLYWVVWRWVGLADSAKNLLFNQRFTLLGKCVDQLQIMSVSGLASGCFTHRPHRGSAVAGWRNPLGAVPTLLPNSGYAAGEVY